MPPTGSFSLVVASHPNERVLGRLEQRYEARRVADRERLPALGFWFDDEAADRVITFIESYCRHHKGEWAGQLLILEPWQRAILREAFGWMRADGTRRFRTVYIEVARKNGKTEVAGSVGLYLLVGDDEPGAEIYCTATKEDQSRILFDVGVEMRKQSPEISDVTVKFQKSIVCHALGSKFRFLGSDSDTLDGLNPHGNLVDELHAHKDPHVYNVLATAMGARRQPMTFVITTAGLYEPGSIGWQQHEYAIKVLDRVIEDETFFAYVAAADPEDDWTDPATWGKANPNLGVSVKWDYLADLVNRAKNEPSFLNTFLRYHLNIWTQQQDRWITIEHWNASEPGNLTPAEYEARWESLRGRPCFVGLDLSTKLDITACSYVFPPLDEDDAWVVMLRPYIPRDRIMDRVTRDRVPYDAWVTDGWLVATPGNVIDYEFIKADLLERARHFDLREVAFDPWSATQLAVQLQGEGLTMVEMRQGFASLSEPSKEFEKLIVSGKIRHGGHPVLRWMVNNVAIREDPAGNIKPDKEASAEKIDGVVATIMGIGRATVAPDTEESGIEFL